MANVAKEVGTLVDLRDFQTTTLCRQPLDFIAALGTYQPASRSVSHTSNHDVPIHERGAVAIDDMFASVAVAALE